MWNSKRRVTTAFYLVMLIIVFAVAVAVSHFLSLKIFLYDLLMMWIDYMHMLRMSNTNMTRHFETIFIGSAILMFISIAFSYVRNKMWVL